MIPHHSPNIEKLLSYIASGVTQSQAATALGITPSAVTQLLQTPEAIVKLEKLKEEQIERSTELDKKYDSIEAKLLDQLEKTIPMLMRPGEISAVLSKINQAKRRGAGAAKPAGQMQVIQLNLPTAIQNRFTLDARNTVVTAGKQDLVTLPSTAVPKLLEAQNEKREDEFGFPITAPKG